MICDLAETYHIFNYRELPVKLLATLVTGLRADSRTKMALTGTKVSDEIALLAIIYDRLTQWVWMNSEDGKNKVNRPESLYEHLTREYDPEIIAFDSGEEFDRAWAEAVGGR